MDEFIQSVAGKLGMPEATAQGLTGGILKVIKDQCDAGDFGNVLSSVPSAERLLDQAGSGGGGMLGGLMGKAADLVGGGAGSALDVASLFSKFDIDSQKAGSFVSMLVGFLKGKVGDDLMGKLLGSVPQLAQLAG